MLTDGKILELFDATGGDIVGRLSRFARAIEAEVLQTQEPAGEIIMYAPYGKLSDPFARPEWHGGALPPVGTKLYTAPQPPAPCQNSTDMEYYRAECEKLQAKVAELEQFKQMWAISCAERDALQANVSEQRAEIERLNRGMTVYTEAFEAECRTTDEQSALIEQLGGAMTRQHDSGEQLATRVMEQAALIAEYEAALSNITQYVASNGDTWPADRAFAAIAAHKKGIAQ